MIEWKSYIERDKLRSSAHGGLAKALQNLAEIIVCFQTSCSKTKWKDAKLFYENIGGQFFKLDGS